MTQEILEHVQDRDELWVISMTNATIICILHTRQSNGSLMAQEIPPSIKKVLTFHAHMPQLFAYLSFPASSPVNMKGGLTTLNSMRKCCNYLHTCLFPPLRQGRGQAAWWHRVDSSEHWKDSKRPCANAVTVCLPVLSRFFASEKKKDGLMGQAIPPSIKSIMTFHALMPQCFPTCPFLPLRQRRGKAAWWRRVDSSQHWKDFELPRANAAIFSYLSFPASYQGRGKASWWHRRFLPILKGSWLSLRKCCNYLPTCPFPPLRQGRGNAAWWRRIFLLLLKVSWLFHAQIPQ